MNIYSIAGILIRAMLFLFIALYIGLNENIHIVLRCVFVFITIMTHLFILKKTLKK